MYGTKLSSTISIAQKAANSRPKYRMIAKLINALRKPSTALIARYEPIRVLVPSMIRRIRTALRGSSDRLSILAENIRCSTSRNVT